MRKSSLSSLLQDPVKSTAFLEFLKTQHADETFRFVLSCEELKKLPPVESEKETAEARRIYAEFCADDAPHAVFVRGESGLHEAFAGNNLAAMLSALGKVSEELETELVLGRLDEFVESSFFHHLLLASQSRKAALDQRVVTAAVALCRPPEWRRKGDLEVFSSLSQESDESFTLCERQTWEDWTPEQLADAVFCDEQHMPLAHPDFCKEAYLVSECSEDFKVIEWVIRAQAGLRAQEHVSVLGVVRTRLPESGSVLVLRKSIPWPDELLPVPAPTRTNVSVAGYLIEPAAHGARITRFGTVRLGTSVSMHTRKSIAKTAAKILPKLKQYHNNLRRK